jgi:AcrR family transcriptional regulator
MTAHLEDTGAKRRCAATTREAILLAAVRRFATLGYEHSGAREIAADAGVTAALVNRYFGSKEGLFAAVIDRAYNCGHYLEGPLDSLPDRLARKLVFPLESSDPELAHVPLLLLLRSATDPEAAELLRANLDRNFVAPLAARLDGPDAEIRATLVGAQLHGFATLDHILRSRAFAGAERERLASLLAEAIRGCLGMVPGPSQ